MPSGIPPLPRPSLLRNGSRLLPDGTAIPAVWLGCCRIVQRISTSTEGMLFLLSILFLTVREEWETFSLRWMKRNARSYETRDPTGVNHTAVPDFLKITICVQGRRPALMSGNDQSWCPLVQGHSSIAAR
jgi:hypothetical protein